MKMDEFLAHVYLHGGLCMKKKIKLIKFAKIFDPYKGLPWQIYIISLGRVINAAGSFIFPLLTYF